VYVDAADSCNMLTFSISENSLVTPMWSIRITQYARDFENKAPPGCLQYLFGSDTGVIRSFNWNGGAGRHLSNQNQLICIRREATRFRICYSQEGGAVLNDFLISSGGAAGDVSAQVGVLGSTVSTFVALSIFFSRAATTSKALSGFCRIEKFSWWIIYLTNPSKPK
jgi:hypothetical protein